MTTEALENIRLLVNLKLDIERQIRAYKNLINQKDIPLFVLSELENHTNEYDVPSSSLVKIVTIIIKDLEQQLKTVKTALAEL